MMMNRGLFVAGAGGGPAPMPTQQEICDRIQAELRASTPRPLFRPPPPRPAPLPPTEDGMMKRLADEVEYMQRIVKAVGERLACDAVITSRHPQTLQQFDIVGQVLGHIANVLATDAREEAASRIGMNDLRGRLTRRSL